MAPHENRRKLKNVMVDSGAQLRLFIPFFILLIVSGGISFIVLWKVLHSIAEISGSLALTDSAMLLQLNELSSTVTQITMVGLGAMGLLTLGFWLFYSHRIFGPTVPIIRKLESLRKGKFEEPIKLRKFDELRPIADSVNELAESVRTSSYGDSKKTGEGDQQSLVIK